MRKQSAWFLEKAKDGFYVYKLRDIHEPDIFENRIYSGTYCRTEEDAKRGLEFFNHSRPRRRKTFTS